MESRHLLAVIVVCALATFLTRFVPMWWQRRRATRSAGASGTWRRALDAVGPAAIVALLVTSFWGMIAPAQWLQDTLPIVVGLAGVAAGKRWLGGIAAGTLGGVVAYGAAIWLLG